MLLPPMAGCDVAEASPPPTTPTVGQATPLLTHTPCYSVATAASHRSRTSEPSYSSSHGHPLPRLPRLHVVPFLASSSSTALVLSAWRGQRPTCIRSGLYVERLTVGSTATHKEMPPYYMQNNDSSTSHLGPTERASVFHETTLPPLTARTHQLYVRTQGKCLLITHKKNEYSPC